ncbi:alpha-scruin-like [Tachypleus tridentatus]|uniref:alpha-scruin-like n=1 Tax=Tachypleus tridentatus TaxID=6853 RepID=UPI003FD508F4
MAKYQYPEPAQRALSESYEFVYSKNKSKDHIDKLDPNFGTIQSMPKVELEERNDHLRRWRTLKNFRQGLPIVNYLANESNPVIMVLGGINTVQPTDYLNSAAMFLFHPDRNKWNFLGTILEPRVYHAGVYLHGRVYVFGGYNPLECVKDKMQITSTTLQYTLRSRQWRRRTDMRNTRAYHGATVMDERIFVIGGKDSDGNILASVEVYQPEIDQWTIAASMPQPLMGISVTNNSGFIYVIGGVGCVREKKTETYLSGKVYCFNPLYNKWFRKSPLASPRAFAAATTQNKRIWIWGGANLLGSDETLSSINTVDVLDTRTGSLEHHLSFDLPKHCLTVAKTKDQVFVIGGMSSLKQTATAEVEIYDRKRDLMQNWASLPIALTGMVAVVIPTDTGVAYKIEQFTTRTKKTDIQRRQQAAKMIQMEYRKYYKKKVKANGHRQNYIVKKMSSDADEIISGRFRAYQSGYRPKLPDQDDVSKDLIPVSIPAWPPDPDPVDSVFATVVDQCHDPNESVGFKHYYTLPRHMDPNIGMIQFLDEDYQHSKNILGLRNVEKIPYYMNRFQPTGDIQDFSVPVIITVGGVDPRDPMNLSYGRSVFQYHPLKDRWEFFGLMPVPRNYHAAVYYDGMIYVTGGYDPNIRRWGEMLATKTTFTYKLSVKEWSRISDMRCARSHHTMVVFNDSIYVIGGRDSSGRLVSSVEIYSPETDEWEMEKPMPKPRMGMASVPHAGYIWVLGGFTSIKSGEKKSSMLDDVLCYDPISKQWVKGSPLRIPKAYSAALVCKGHIWLCGGAVPSLDRNNCLVSVSSIDVYDEETQEWKQETLLNHPRHSAIAITLESCIYVIGGVNSFEMSPTSRNVLYMTDTKTIHPIRELPIPVTGMAGVTVPPKCLTFRSESLSIMIRHKVTP